MPHRQTWRERRRTLVQIYGTSLALWLPLLALLRLRNIDFLGAAWRIGGAAVETGSMFRRLLDNSSFLLQGLVIYFGALPLVLAGLLMLLALLTRPRRAGLLALASLLAFFAVTLSGSNQLSMRYWLLALPPALLLCVSGLIVLRKRLRTPGLTQLPWLALALWLVTLALPFLQTAWYTPTDLTLPRTDSYEYIMADSAGTMIPELATLLAQEARQVEGTPGRHRRHRPVRHTRALPAGVAGGGAHRAGLPAHHDASRQRRGAGRPCQRAGASAGELSRDL